MSNGEEITFIEMFAGIGGFRLGLEQSNSGYKCVWTNENNKWASKIYKKNFGSEELNTGDIREIQTKEIPNFEVLTAGFPCQAFSVAGKRKGLEENRGTLFSHVIRVATLDDEKDVIGDITFDAGWWAYSFFPYAHTKYEWVCLREIAAFCEKQTKLWRKKIVEAKDTNVKKGN